MLLIHFAQLLAKMAAIMNTAGGLTDGLVSKGHAIIDALFPPEKRSQWMEKLKAFAVSNPKLTVSILKIWP